MAAAVRQGGPEEREVAEQQARLEAGLAAVEEAVAGSEVVALVVEVELVVARRQRGRERGRR